jgi:hypothetical protein
MSGSPEHLPLELVVQTVCVIDTGVLINFKKLININEQWDLLMEMRGLVQIGRLAFPKQVVSELAEIKFPDAPGAWIGSARKLVVYPQPSEETLRRVLAAAQLVDPNSTGDSEVADPYVAALALEIDARPDCHAVLATDDEVDRMPAKESLNTACVRLGIERWNFERFMEWLRGTVTL